MTSPAPASPTASTDKLARFMPTLVSLLILALALGITGAVWKHVQDTAALENQARFDARAREIAERIEHHLLSYELVLRGASGLLSVSDQISRARFKDYFDTLNLDASYPGMQSAGFSLTAPEAASTILYRGASRATGSPATGMRDNVICRTAMERAHDMDSVYLSGKLALDSAVSGFIMCVPVYAANSRNDTTEFRRANIAAWVTMHFGMDKLMFGILGDLYQDDAITIHDGEAASAQNLMYASRSTGLSAAQFSAVKHLDVAGHYWTLTVAREDAGMLSNKGNPQLILYTGTGISLLLSLLSWLLLTGRANALSAAEMLSHELAERRRNEKELRLAATVYDTMDEAVTVTDADNRFVSVNPAFTAITGYAREEVLGKNPRILSSGIQPPEFYREMWATLSDTGMWQGEISNRRKNGDVYVEWLSIKRVGDEAKNSVYYIAVFSDISKRKAAEKLLRESSDTLHAVIETAMDAVVLTDASGTITDWNAQAEEIFGLTKEEACGRDLQDMVAPFKYLDGSVSNLREFLLLKNGTSRHSLIETSAIHRDGHEFPIELTVALIRMKGKRAFSCFIHDVSARRARDNALRAANLGAEAASRAKSDFLANMSHEIRTPMNSILGMAYLTLKTELTAKQRDYIEKIDYSGQHLLGIINDILDFSKIEAGKLRIENVNLKLHKIIENIANMLGGKAAEKGLALDFVIAPDIPEHLRGDPLRLGQVLINYISNAIKFTAQGSITIYASKVEEGEGNILLRFDVLDTGIGISEKGIANLFQLFQQADTSTTRKFGGTGLGLAISKQLAELMGGAVGVNSEIGKGSNFWFTAALEKAQPPTVGDNEPDETRQQNARQALNGARILLVEDNPFNQQVATDLLELAGVAVTIADNGQAALDILRQQRFDCVLMDMQMPEMDGLEATRRIRADAALADTLIIAMTANTRNEDRENCIAAGMDDLITKPILPELLYATLATHLTKQAFQITTTTAPDEAQGDPEIIDLAILSRMVMHDRAQVRKYATRFLASAQDGMLKLETALANADLPALAALGHRIKSSARTVGAIGFANRCQALEQQDMSLAQATEIVADMSCLLAQIKEQIEGIAHE